MKFRKVFLVPILLIFLVIIAATGSFFWWKNNSQPVSTDKETKDFVVAKGRGATQIAQELYKQGLIRSPLAFKFYIQFKGKAEDIQAGRYSLTESAAIPEIVTLLTKGPKDLWVTVPEGLRHEEIAERFIQGLAKEGEEAEEFRQEFISASKSSEGYLFPDTYLFPREANASIVISSMRDTFDKKTKDIKSTATSKLNWNQIVTLASIIERETKIGEERSIVAGILMNRLNIGMALQADAAVQYAVSNAKCQILNAKCNDWWPILTLEDLQIDSPFNTYKYQGLPPSPISNPGLSSIEAAVKPADTEYIYYIHDPEGNIHYAKTLAEHNENVRKYLGK